MSLQKIVAGAIASFCLLRVDAAECSPKAISLPIKRNVLSNRAEIRGIPLAVGTPARNLAVTINASSNDTYLWGPESSCPVTKDFTIETCVSTYGGIYDPKASNTSVSTSSDSIRHFPDGILASWAQETVTLDNATELSSFEIGSTSSFNEWVPQSKIGVGRSSTMLQALNKENKLTSKSYGYFQGTDFGNETREGSFILGGYDANLLDPVNNITLPTALEFQNPAVPCKEGMVLNVTGLDLTWPDGNVDKLMQDSETLTVCVVPDWPSIISFPEKYWNRTLDKTGYKPRSDGTAFSGGLYFHTQLIEKDSPGNFTGTFTITLENKLSVTFSNDQFVMVEPKIRDDGILVPAPEFANVLVENLHDRGDEDAKLGALFFAAAYLMVDHDKGEFTIAKANTEADSQKIMGIDTPNNCVAELQEGSLTSSPPKSSTTNTNKSNPTDEDQSTSLTRGAIAGIALGGVVFVSLIAGAVFFFWRRKRSAAGYEVPRTDSPPPEKVTYGYAEGRPSEMQDNDRPSEMPLHEWDHVVELPGVASTSERRTHELP
ncbi:hypothetical protein P154DRAFT_518036 [Amniculicola lignicola CBS 123094]|uniref:Acid protease n=1 Tax=Amniculicola lignicola CBS 123094 TaxID=1392246 RepID=A0A6A5WX80_9PLEO|nr:hypothetical protein P154DRAFT_518036 [Amniculicola lignicola CBS 123094]